MSILFNPTAGKIRSDSVGDGHFGARRGRRIHAGLDLEAIPGQDVYSPISGTAIRTARPYVGDSRWLGIFIEGKIFDVKMFYLMPEVDYPSEVKRGERIGVAQDIGLKYEGCTPHVHLEVYLKAGRALTLQGYWTDDPIKLDPATMIGIYED
jgi:murein DD-endopeptidase MepM/ murein hydrolase activator NlpD